MPSGRLGRSNCPGDSARRWLSFALGRAVARKLAAFAGIRLVRQYADVLAGRHALVAGRVRGPLVRQSLAYAGQAHFARRPDRAHLAA